MGQDGVYLQVIATSGEGREQRHAKKVYQLLQRGKHWVLVTLLLSNVIVNETLPIVLDRSLGGGWPAVLGSTVLIGTWSLCNQFSSPLNTNFVWLRSSISISELLPAIEVDVGGRLVLITNSHFRRSYPPIGLR